MLKAIAPRIFAVFAAILLLSALSFAGNDDWHLSRNGDRVFFLRSAFAHGYMHGYEEGFHEGDMDLQMGRTFRAVKSQDRFKKICGYREEFGDHVSFEDGYRKGYAVGYSDSYSGRNFRATRLLELAKSESLPDASAAPDRAFDRAFKAGYNTGQRTGLEDGRSAAPLANLDSVHCKGISAKDACTAYQQGYRLGYSDGYANQHTDGAVLALK